MASCHNLFQDFHQNIRLLKSKRDKMKSSKEALRKKIVNHFKEKHPEYKPKFYIQGSYKTKNGIRYKDDTADLDDGVYFERDPDVTATTLQKWVYEAVEGHTSGGQQHKKKCIRVIYAGDFHIDLPVLYKTDDMDHPRLAVKNEGWVDDDPKEFVEWFNRSKDQDGQLIRDTMYLKAWGDHKRNSMPSGLCMTILGEKNAKYDDRDDISLHETLKNIKNSLSAFWTCTMPTWPYENLFEKYDQTFKDNFFKNLDAFIEDADEAIQTDDKGKASKLWRKHLGDRFPKYENTEENSSSNNSSKAALAGVAYVSKPWGH
ncbi:CBASS cGAMP synthase [Marinoscillum luteum]|uniref:Cyclic GMP-AMP synthase n=1 Tax=Marinoscillum luteum TaxID=861051 RepID=A0ABW7N6Y3_9BACT